MTIEDIKNLPQAVPPDRRVMHGTWFSTTESGPQLTDTGVIASSSTAYLQELQKLGQASTNMSNVWNANSTDPYPARLRPVTSLQALRNARQVWVSSMNFTAYDTTYLVGGVAGTGQDLATVQAIVNSQAYVKNAYMQARTSNTVIGGWQPNFFRPRIIIDGAAILPELDGTNGGSLGTNTGHLGDLSIGLPLPYCWEPYEPYPVHDVSSIDIWAPCAQYIAETERYQRYPVQCTVEFLWV